MRSVPWVFSLHRSLLPTLPLLPPFPHDRRWLHDNQHPVRLRQRDLRLPGWLPPTHMLGPSQDGPFRAHYCLPFTARPSRKRCRDKSWQNILANRRKSDGGVMGVTSQRSTTGQKSGSAEEDHCRPPSIEEKEKLLGFSQGHTEPSTSIRYAKQKPQEVCRIWHALLDRSAHCQVLAWAVQTGLRYLRLPVRGCRSGAELLRTMADDAPAGHAPVIEGSELIRQLRRRQHHKGSEIRHASPMGTPSGVSVGQSQPSVVEVEDSSVHYMAVSRAHQHSGNENVLRRGTLTSQFAVCV